MWWSVAVESLASDIASFAGGVPVERLQDPVRAVGNRDVPFAEQLQAMTAAASMAL